MRSKLLRALEYYMSKIRDVKFWYAVYLCPGGLHMYKMRHVYHLHIGFSAAFVWFLPNVPTHYYRCTYIHMIMSGGGISCRPI